MNLHESKALWLVRPIMWLQIENQAAKMALIILLHFRFHALQYLKLDLSCPLTI